MQYFAVDIASLKVTEFIEEVVNFLKSAYFKLEQLKNVLRVLNRETFEMLKVDKLRYINF